MVELSELKIKDFLSLTASNAAVPGGGSASALAILTGISLIEMVAELTIGKKKYLDVQEEFIAIKEKASDLFNQLKRSMEEDAESFETVMEAYGLDKSDPMRAELIEQRTLFAAEVPFNTAKKGLSAIKLVETCIGKGNKNANSDAKVAKELLMAGIKGCLYNVRINAESLDNPRAKELIKESYEIENSLL